MPKEVEDALKKEAKKKGMKGDQANKYVYGAMNNMGYMHGNKTVSDTPTKAAKPKGLQSFFKKKGKKK